MANPLEKQIVRYDDVFEWVDARIFRVEAGVITFALLAMSLTYFLKIIYEAVVADRNFVDSFLLRWMHSGEGEAPAELVAMVHGGISPLLVLIVTLLLGVGAARTAQGRIHQSRLDDQLQRGGGDVAEQMPPWSLKTVGLGVLIAAGFALVGYLVMTIPSRWLCAGAYVGLVALFGLRARRAGDLAMYAATWGALSVPIGVLIWRIPGQYAWVNDLCKVLIMYVGFLGASMASRERKHIVLNFGRRLWPLSLGRAIETLSLTVWLAFNLLLLALAWHLFDLQLTAGSTLAILPIPEFHISLPVVICFTLMSIRVLADLVRNAAGSTPVPRPRNPGGPVEGEL